MDVDELLHVVRTENLDTPIIDGAGFRRGDAVVVDHAGARWTVHVLDEHEHAIGSTVRMFTDETAAMWHVLRRLRQIAEARRTGAARTDHLGSRRSVDFAPRSIGTGAALPVSAAAVLDAIVSRLAEPKAPVERRDQWLADDVLVFSRGDAWIVPLSWTPAHPDIDGSEYPHAADRASTLFAQIGTAAEHQHGWPIALGLRAQHGAESPRDEKSRYTAELTRTGATSASWWAFGDVAVVRILHRSADQEPSTQMALHVVPTHWVKEGQRRKKAAGAPLDLGWSWADVVEFTRTEHESE